VETLAGRHRGGKNLRIEHLLHPSASGGARGVRGARKKP
jgi:hypothetical protein